MTYMSESYRGTVFLGQFEEWQTLFLVEQSANSQIFELGREVVVNEVVCQFARVVKSPLQEVWAAMFAGGLIKLVSNLRILVKVRDT